MPQSDLELFPDWLEPAACNLTLVFGPPGSGKSTYVRARRGPSDTVINLAEIVIELAGRPYHRVPECWLDVALKERNRRLNKLKERPPSDRVWFITEGASLVRRAWWERKLRPREVVFLAVSFQECLRRIYLDEHGYARDRRVMALRRWWTHEVGGSSKDVKR